MGAASVSRRIWSESELDLYLKTVIIFGIEIITYQGRPEKARSISAKAFLWSSHLPIFPHKAWVDQGNRFSNTFPSVPSGDVEPLTFGLRDKLVSARPPLPWKSFSPTMLRWEWLVLIKKHVLPCSFPAFIAILWNNRRILFLLFLFLAPPDGQNIFSSKTMITQGFNIQKDDRIQRIFWFDGRRIIHW